MVHNLNGREPWRRQGEEYLGKAEGSPLSTRPSPWRGERTREARNRRSSGSPASERPEQAGPVLTITGPTPIGDKERDKTEQVGGRQP